MSHYVVYDRTTGEVVHTHASYALGSDEPVAVAEDEVRAVLPQALAERDLGVAPVPESPSVRSRADRLEVVPATGEVRWAPRKDGQGQSEDRR